MPRTAGLSGRTTILPRLRSPSCASVRLCCSGRLIPLRTKVTFSFFAIAYPAARISSLRFPRRDAMESALLSFFKATIVACITLWGFEVPMHFEPP